MPEESLDPLVEELRRRLGITGDEPRRAGVVSQRQALDDFERRAAEHRRHLEQLVLLERQQKNEPLRELMRRLGRT